MGDPSKKIAAFWAWFVGHLEEINTLVDGDDPFWDKVLKELKRVDRRLMFEVSVPRDGVREFVMTAEGHVEAFGTVDELAARAPEVQGWRFVALKPAMGFEFKMRIEGVELNPAEMRFAPLELEEDPDALALRVAVANLTPANRRQVENGVLIILDTGLGERAAVLEIAGVDVVKMPTNAEDEGYVELSLLPAFLEMRRQERGKR